MNSTTRFSTQLWEENISIYKAILKQPFIAGLIDGSLDPVKFSEYIHQDTLYLQEYSRVLSRIAAMCPDAQDVLTFNKFSEGAVVTEMQLHQNFKPGLPPPMSKGKNPACFSYTNYLLATTAYSGLEVACAAVLPCFWIYEEVGKYAYKSATSKNNRYQPWLDTYAGDLFKELVDQMIGIVDKLADKASETTKTRMKEAYTTASKMEYAFWDDAYQLRKGPDELTF